MNLAATILALAGFLGRKSLTACARSLSLAPQVISPSSVLCIFIALRLSERFAALAPRRRFERACSTPSHRLRSAATGCAPLKR